MAEPLGSEQPRILQLPRDCLVVRGPDRKAWLDGLLTCAVTAVVPGTAGYGLLLTKQGKIVSDVFLVESGSELFVGVAPGKGDEVRELLDRYLVMEDAELEAPRSPLAFYVTSTAQSLPGELAGGVLAVSSLKANVGVAAPGVAGADAAGFAELWAAHGLGVFGVDFGPRDNPHEASLDRVAVNWSKGCYLGQEVVCMQDMRGKVKRRLVALEGGAELLARVDGPSDVCLPDGSVAGQVSSVHPLGSGARLLASLSTSALESHAVLSVRGAPVRVVETSAANGVGAPPGGKVS
jgi:folate-binding protein YgfZ